MLLDEGLNLAGIAMVLELEQQIVKLSDGEWLAFELAVSAGAASELCSAL